MGNKNLTQEEKERRKQEALARKAAERAAGTSTGNGTDNDTSGSPDTATDTAAASIIGKPDDITGAQEEAAPAGTLLCVRNRTENSTYFRCGFKIGKTWTDIRVTEEADLARIRADKWLEIKAD